MFTGYWKVLVLKFSEMENTVFFRVKKLMERWYLLNTETFLFWTFQRWEIRSFLSQKVDGKMITDYWWLLITDYWLKMITDYWKVLVLNLLETGNRVFFSAKKLMESWYLLIAGKFLFWTFWRWEIRSLFSQNIDANMIFTWLFWAFHDIPGLGKYGFLCSDIMTILPFNELRHLLNMLIKLQ